MQFIIEYDWIAVSQIIFIDILLGGDNAIVIALACRNLPHALRIKGIVYGTCSAIVIRIFLIIFAVQLLQVPYIKLISGILLLWISIKLLNSNNNRNKINSSEKLWIAIKNIICADFVMSFDNVIAIASIAEQAEKYKIPLIIFGILVSIPIIIWGSTLILRLIIVMPFIIKFCAIFLGYLAGAMIISDIILQQFLWDYFPYHDIVISSLNLHLSIPALICAFSIFLLSLYTTYRTF